ncbi:MAG: replication protein P [Pseudomonadota bacterium]
MTIPSAIAPSAAPVPTTRPYSQWFEPHPSLKISLIDHLYNRLDGAYPHKWRSNFPDAQAIDNWAESWVEAFEEQGITPSDVLAGLKVCRSRYTWPPSCAEFIQACRPFADPSIAYHEAVVGLEARGRGAVGEWSHPAVFWAAKLLERDLMGQTYSQVKDCWAHALKAQMARTEWAEIPPPRQQLPAPGDGKLSKEAAAQMLRELDAAGIVKRPNAHFDHKRWARRIIAAVAQGDTTLTLAQVQMATDALGPTTGPPPIK